MPVKKGMNPDPGELGVPRSRPGEKKTIKRPAQNQKTLVQRSLFRIAQTPFSGRKGEPFLPRHDFNV